MHAFLPQFLSLLSLLSAPAQAGPFTQRHSMGVWPDRQIEREFVLPRGWLQLGLSADSKSSTGYRDTSGSFVAYQGDTAFRSSTFQIQVDQGFARRISLYARVPMVLSSLTNDHGANASVFALGDIHTGLIVQPWLARSTTLAFRLDLKSPSGLEWPEDYIGGPSDTSSFLTGTGVTNLAPHLHARQRFGKLATLDLQAGYVWKFPAVVGYVLEDNGFGLGWLDPGNELLLQGDLLVQVLDDLAVGGSARYSQRGPYSIGTKGAGTDAPELQTIANSEGAFTDIGGSVSFEPSTHFEVQARLSSQVLGSDTRLFAPLGLEEFSPQPGLTLGCTGVYRW